MVEELRERNIELERKLEAGSKELLAKIDELTSIIKAQAEQIAALLARLGTDSTNSSKPPSSDGPAAKQRSLRTATGRKPGGQKGRTGKTLEMVENPDVIEDHYPQRCRGCDSRVTANGASAGFEQRQVFDLPEDISLAVTEHRLHKAECRRCGQVTAADAPAGVTRQVQYGARVSSFMTYLGAAHHISLSRASELAEDLFDAPISPATINKMMTDAASTIASRVKPVIGDILASGAIAHVDETGFKIGGKTKWVHTISNPIATWIEVHDKRGKQAPDDIGILPRFTGILIHDAWAPYDKYDQVTAHQLCCAHVLRELKAVRDVHDHDAREWCWSAQTSDALASAIHDPGQVSDARYLITSALACAGSDTKAASGKLGAKERALGRRLSNRLNDYLRFAKTDGVPPTNNPAEQEIRAVKIKQKMSGGMRTMKGAQTILAIRSYISTARKNGKKALEAISSLSAPTPWLPALP